MPFRPQPLKKKAGPGKAPQECTNGSCGHPEHKKKEMSPAEQKAQITSLLQKLSQKFATEAKTAEKAAIIISAWIKKPKK